MEREGLATLTDMDVCDGKQTYLKVFNIGAGNMVQCLKTFIGVSSSGPTFNSRTQVVAHNHLPLQFQGI